VKRIRRKKILRAIVPACSSVILYARHGVGSGRDLFASVCAQDLEGIVAERKESRYGDQLAPWFKIKNREYSHARDRHEVFERASRAGS
jgi:ATP-dependent DNA ligase